MLEIIDIAATFTYQQAIAATFNYEQAIALPVEVYAATIRDNFAVAVAVGSIDGTSADAGPGTRTVVDTESKVSIGA